MAIGARQTRHPAAILIKAILVCPDPGRVLGVLIAVGFGLLFAQFNSIFPAHLFASIPSWLRLSAPAHR